MRSSRQDLLLLAWIFVAACGLYVLVATVVGAQ